jgi:hypothetical protein
VRNWKGLQIEHSLPVFVLKNYTQQYLPHLNSVELTILNDSLWDKSLLYACSDTTNRALACLAHLVMYATEKEWTDAARLRFPVVVHTVSDGSYSFNVNIGVRTHTFTL